MSASLDKLKQELYEREKKISNLQKLKKDLHERKKSTEHVGR